MQGQQLQMRSRKCVSFTTPLVRSQHKFNQHIINTLILPVKRFIGIQHEHHNRQLLGRCSGYCKRALAHGKVVLKCLEGWIDKIVKIHWQIVHNYAVSLLNVTECIVFICNSQVDTDHACRDGDAALGSTCVLYHARRATRPV